MMRYCITFKLITQFDHEVPAVVDNAVVCDQSRLTNQKKQFKMTEKGKTYRLSPLDGKRKKLMTRII